MIHDPENDWEKYVASGFSNLITTKEAARLLKVSRRRVRALIASGKLPAYRMGDWRIIKSDLALVSSRRPGYPLGKKRVAPAASK